MKKLKLILLITMLMSMACATAFAYDFKSNGIYYTITSSTDKKVAVTYQNYTSNWWNFDDGNTPSIPSGYAYIIDYNDDDDWYKYSWSDYYGAISIPSSVYNNGQTYQVTSIGSMAFMNCLNVTSISIPTSITSIGDYAFYNCKNVSALTIPSTVSDMGIDVFELFTGSLTLYCSLDFERKVWVYPDDDPAWSYTTKHTPFREGDFSGLILGSGISSIPASSFQECKNLKSVTLPGSIATIGSNAFQDCSSLSVLDMDNSSLQSIGSNAFTNCNKLKTVNISNIANWSNCSLSNSSSSPFCYGADLYVANEEKTIVTFPITTTKISAFLFYGCGNITAVTIPALVETIGDGAFSGCPSLENININSGNTTYSSSNGVLYNAGRTTLLLCPGAKRGTLSLPSSVTTINGFAFSGCMNLSSLTIPSSVVNIGNSAFQGCAGKLTANCDIPNDAFANAQFNTVVIGNNVTTLGSKAFYNCSNINSLTLSNTLTSIGWSAFEGCNGLISLTIPNSVTSIGSSAFSGCSSLTSIAIPSSLTSIESSTFKNCSGLVSVAIPNSVTIIRSSAFSGCSSLASIILPNNLTNIGSWAFYNCSSLKSITIPKSVTSIDGSAFEGCSSLTSVSLHCKSIGTWFSGLTSIKEIVFGDEVTSVGSSAFHYCSGLTSIDIPNGVTSIGTSAFENCSGLTSATIGTGVTNIGYAAFRGCSLTAFICKATTPPTLGSSNTFDGKKKIYVPFESLDAYKSAWSQLAEPTYSYYPLLDVMFFEKQTAESYAEGLKNKAKTGITSVAFYEGGLDADLTENVMKSGMNPNCLYYVPADAELSGDNIISLDSYEATKVSLTDSYSFDCPIPFHVSEIEYVHNPSVWANGSAGWETICLPFAPHSYKASGRGYISPIMLGTKGNFWLRKYVGASSDAVYFSSTLDGKMEANTPYLVAFPGSTMGTGHLQGQTITFLGSNADIDVTQQPEVRNNDYVFVGNYDTIADGTEGWALNGAGNSFVKSGTVGDKPFCAYFKNMAGDAATSRLQISFDETTDIEGLKDTQTDITIMDGGNGTLVVQSGTSRMLSIYKTDGRLERSIQLRAGENHIEGLKKGVYIIDNQKVLVR